ncbi:MULTISPECIES: hypothetical protein [unclassified Nostoc]|uniref:hypothetical protein n=1 Tax=unclassified Nostoc TaxID=2593658 RepID=UPI00262DFC2A|nr:hypothetical protein [Nostoc sp. S13]MDF5734956.1 hypothetical protein [Nostoc sp. S13]
MGRGSREEITYAPCPMPNAQCPILRLLYETLRERSVQVPNAQCPFPEFCLEALIVYLEIRLGTTELMLNINVYRTICSISV